MEKLVVGVGGSSRFWWRAWWWRHWCIAVLVIADIDAGVVWYLVLMAEDGCGELRWILWW